MPTELKLQIFIPNVSAKDYYRIVLSDNTCIRKFHKEVNKDPEATATPWDNGQRSVSFRMTLNVPAMIKKVIGTDCIRVVEVSKLTWTSEDSFDILSEPCLDFPAANKFTTSGQSTVSNVPGGCQVDCIMKCSAALPWPMQSSVESVMVQEAKATVGKYLDFTRLACEEDLNNRAVLAPPGAVPLDGAAAGPAGDEDVFFDADENVDATGNDFTGAGSAGREAGPLEAYEHLSRDEVALRCLLQIQKSCVESTLLMRQVQGNLQSLDAHIAAMHDALLQGKPASARPSAVQPRQSASLTWTSVLCLGLAGASLASIVYLRAKHRTAGGGSK